MNELNMSSAVRHSTQVGNRPSSVSSANASSAALPPKSVEPASSGNELPPVSKSAAEKKGSEVATHAVDQRSKEVDVEQTKKAVENLNEVAVSLQRDLNFKMDDDTGKSIITVTDSVTKEVIRQIPSVEIVELAKKLQSMMQSVPTSSGEAKVDSPAGSLFNITA